MPLLPAPKSKMATVIAGAAARATVASKFQTALAGAAVRVPYRIPMINLDCMIRVVGGERLLEIEAASNKAMLALGFEQNALTQTKYELSVAQYVLAEALLDPETDAPIGTREDIGDLPVSVIAAAWARYGDVCELYDPLNTDMRLTREEQTELANAVEKKNHQLLRLFGARRLSAYLLITADQHANSPTPRSSAGEPWPEPQDTDSGETSEH